MHVVDTGTPTKQLAPPAPARDLAAVRREVSAAIAKHDTVIAQGIGEALQILLRDISAKIGALEARLNDLQAAMAEVTTFKGIWAAGTSYTRGSIVTIPALGAYVALSDTATRPGASDAWQLVLKSGRDGRDGKDAVAPAPDPPDPPAQRTARGHRSVR